MLIQFERGKQTVVETPLLHRLRSDLPKQMRAKLVSYVAHENGRICLGEWVNRDRGWVREIASYGPEGPSQGVMNQVIYHFSEQRKRDQRMALAHLRGANRDQNRLHDEQLQQYRDTMGFYSGRTRVRI